jgi:thiol-disulfide isomerase/thioredoxin
MKSLPIFSCIVVLFGIYALFTDFSPADPWRKKRTVETPQRMNKLASTANTLKNWPPRVDETFPEISFYDHSGQEFKLSSLRGRPVLIEMVAMTCAGCQGLSGGNSVGGFGGFVVQRELQSLEEYFPHYTEGHQLFSEELWFVQIVVYNLRLNHPVALELDAWREHFHFNEKPNTFVISGGAALASGITREMIPGFYLLDKNLVVRYDATGQSPKHNLWNELLPAIPTLIKE